METLDKENEDWLFQAIILEEVLSKLPDTEELGNLDSMAWHYTKLAQRYISVGEISVAVDEIKEELQKLRGKYGNKNS